jgi:hypothetical protein
MLGASAVWRRAAVACAHPTLDQWLATAAARILYGHWHQRVAWPLIAPAALDLSDLLKQLGRQDGACLVQCPLYVMRRESPSRSGRSDRRPYDKAMPLRHLFVSAGFIILRSL